MKKKILVLLAFVVFISLNLNAQNYNDAIRLSDGSIDFDARTLALSNSTIASYGNFSSALINPAALATIKKDLFTISFNSNDYENNTTFLGNANLSDSKNSNTGQVGLVLPLPTRKGSAVLAFGYNNQKDFNSIVEFKGLNSGNTSIINDLTYSDYISDREFAWELGLNSAIDPDRGYYETNINGGLQQDGSITEEGSVNNWIISGGIQAAEDLFVGATFNIVSGDYFSKRSYYEEDVNNLYSGFVDAQDSNTFDFQLFYLEDLIDWDIDGWDFRLGLLYTPNSFINFGATIKFPTYYTITEKYDLYSTTDFANTYFEVDPIESENEYEIKTPMELNAGVSANLPFVKVNAALGLIDYSQIEFTGGFDKDILSDKNNDINELLQSVVNVNFGAEVTLPYPALKLRTGFMLKPSPYKNDDSDFDKKFFTAGLGFPLSKNLILDFAYLHGWWNSYADNYGSNVSRYYEEIKLDKMVLSINYIF